ncbi:hypothetical protein [Bacillus sp. FJAT-22090]|uniref:hypothetical protein n=1 Tax=Bacillus sp. FJAT-22090 TaxID=1581038 RepID=UPI0016430C0B|nr:hypothetical protein [Bacillus sp. FJAT-22090]
MNSVQLGGIKFEGKYSRADSKVLTVTNVPKEYEKEKLDMLFDLARFKNIPVISYLDI